MKYACRTRVASRAESHTSKSMGECWPNVTEDRARAGRRFHSSPMVEHTRSRSSSGEGILPFDTGAAIVAVERRHHGRQVTEVEAAQRPTEERRQGTRHGGGEVQARQPEPRAEDPGQGQKLARQRRAQTTSRSVVRVTTATREASTRAAKRGDDGTGWHDARIWQIANAKTSKQRHSWDS